MTIAVGYTRVSTVDQADEGVSLAAQEDRIRAYCKMFAHECRTIHVDSGISGKQMDSRPGLAAALEEVCQQRGILVVYSLSRLSRSVKDTLDIADRLAKSNADLASLTESLDTSSATGRMVFKILAVIAEFERDILSERTSMALKHKAKNGERVGRHAQYGYRLAANGKLVECPAEQATIAVIRRLAQDGHTPAAIARRLNATGGTFRGRLWRTAGVAKVLGR
jgi:site-specific DNA recombinase